MKKSRRQGDRRRASRRGRRPATAAALLQLVSCRYSCRGCGLERVSVEVPMRTLRQPAHVWMTGTLSPALTRDHARRSPLCLSREVSEVVVPVSSLRGWEGRGTAVPLEEGPQEPKIEDIKKE